MFDDILDKGEYDTLYLQPEPEAQAEDALPCLFSPAEESENASVQDDISFSAMRRRESKPAPSRYNRPNHLLVTPNTYNVLLPDFDTKIHFTTQVKALYILFLNHPEGIRLVDIADHKKEYTNIYMNVTTRSDVDKLRAKVLLFYDMTK